MIFLWILGASIALYFFYSWRIDTLLDGATVSETPGRDRADNAPAAGNDEEHDYLDMDALSRPRTNLPTVEVQPDNERTYKGGAAGPAMNVYCSGTVDTNAEPYKWVDRRTATRRTSTGRRESDEQTNPGKRSRSTDDRRLSRRRVWLRRSEDEAQFELGDIDEAARVLATNPDEIEKWIRTADLPFYMVTRGANRELRFDRHELLGWLGVEDVVEARSREGER